MKEDAATITGIERWRDSRLKQQMIRLTLQLRAREPELFTRGEYLPLEMVGALAGHAIGFARMLGDQK